MARRLPRLVCGPFFVDGRHFARGQYAAGAGVFGCHPRRRVRGRGRHHLDSSRPRFHRQHCLQPPASQLPASQRVAPCMQGESPGPLLCGHARPDGGPRRVGRAEGHRQSAARHRHAARSAGKADADHQRHLFPRLRRTLRHHPRGRRNGFLLLLGVGSGKDDEVAERHFNHDQPRRLPPLRAALHQGAVPENRLYPVPSRRRGSHAPPAGVARNRRAQRHSMDARSG